MVLYSIGKKYKAFTLIELLVVISIIGILSSVVLGSLNTAREKSRDAKRKQDMKTIANALQLYYDANGGSFANLLSLDGTTASVSGQTFTQAYYFSTPSYPTGSGRNSWATLQTRLSGFISNLPVDPKNNYNWSGFSFTNPLPLTVRDGYYLVGIASTVVNQPVDVCGSHNVKVTYFIESVLENRNDVGTIRNSYPTLYGCIGDSDGRSYLTRIWAD